MDRQTKEQLWWKSLRDAPDNEPWKTIAKHLRGARPSVSFYLQKAPTLPTPQVIHIQHLGNIAAAFGSK